MGPRRLPPNPPNPIRRPGSPQHNSELCPEARCLGTWLACGPAQGCPPTCRAVRQVTAASFTPACLPLRGLRPTGGVAVPEMNGGALRRSKSAIRNRHSNHSHHQERRFAPTQCVEGSSTAQLASGVRVVNVSRPVDLICGRERARAAHRRLSALRDVPESRQPAIPSHARSSTCGRPISSRRTVPSLR